MRRKRIPKPSTVLLREPGPKQTWQEQLAIAEQWVADAAKQKQRREGLNGR